MLMTTAFAFAAGCGGDSRTTELPATVALTALPTPQPPSPKPSDAPPLVLEGPSCFLWSPERGRFDPGRQTLGLGRSGECYFGSVYASDTSYGCHVAVEGACRGGVGECGGVSDGLSVWFFTQDGPGTCRLTFSFTNRYRETAASTIEIRVGSR